MKYASSRNLEVTLCGSPIEFGKKRVDTALRWGTYEIDLEHIMKYARVIQIQRSGCAEAQFDSKKKLYTQRALGDL